MGENPEKKGVLPQIIVAVVVALLVGGTAPWWWNEIFHRNDVHQPFDHNNPNNNNKKPILGGRIVLTATSNPPIISQGQKTTINVFAQDSQGHPLSSATVTLSVGGGRFDQTGTATVSGQTDSSGVFRAYWSCNYCAPAYIGSVRITKPGYEEADSQWRIEIR